ncbi:MAG: replication protein RepA [Hadesarchaea archaeon]|nr:replication protein RepA [Hadesarchaea archaeon]
MKFSPIEPAKPRKISEIRTADERVSILGVVVDKKEAELLVDDGSGRITVVFDDPSLARDVEVGSTVRVFGAPLSVADAHELHADIIQKLDKLDLKLYEEVRREIKKFEKGLQQ